jgi:light-regulated signal transduction histidine kinase (bacteriophytochrome)
LEKKDELADSGFPVHFEYFNDRQQVWLEISIYPSERNLSVCFCDITQRKEADLNLLEINRLLKVQTEALTRSNKELERFAYVASHDLQEPLRMVTGFLSQLEKKYKDRLDENARKYIHLAVDGAARMRKIILELLEYSRAGSELKEAQRIDLNELLAEVEALNKSDIEAAGAKLYSQGLPIIYSHRAPLVQVLQNLLSNSLKYRHPDRKPEISVHAEQLRDCWQISFAHNGIGISASHLDKVFEMFQRLHSREKYPGTGMGLALCKKIVENFGGKIWATSVEGDGCTINFTIPKASKYDHSSDSDQ